MNTHAAVPFAEYLGEDLFRVYFSSRDKRNRARVGSFLLDLSGGDPVREVNPDPVLDIGPLGSFDDSGIIGSWLVKQGQRRFLYYAGITLGVTVPMYFYSGLAVSDTPDRPFRKISRSPLLERNEVDPYLTGQLCVLREDGLWRMWYVSGERWEEVQGKPRHYYHIKYAESLDGFSWQREGHVCIDFERDEYAIGRPCVLKENGLYRMWYCHRGDSYRIGYGESEDGLHWIRKDSAVGIDASESGWDSEMMAYPFVFQHRGSKYMLYNGNSYGMTGVGLAMLSDD